jgi:hypothetical protein
MTTRPNRISLILAWGIMWTWGGVGTVAFAADEEVYLSPSTFVEEAFALGSVGEPLRFWLTAEVQAEVKKVLGRNYPGLRLRYWKNESRTAWILEEIGKVKPITTGIVVDAGAIVKLQVLVYRESHGWEVRHPFFTDQFQGVKLTDGTQLSESIDGITGATLSVNALRKLGRLALYFDQCVQALPDV